MEKFLRMKFLMDKLGVKTRYVMFDPGRWSERSGDPNL